MKSRRSMVILGSVLAVIVVIALVATLVWQGLAAFYSGYQTDSSTSTGDGSGKPTPAEAQPIEATSVEDFYAQTIQWQPCTAEQITSKYEDAPKNIDEYRCASLTAPLNWDEPTGKQISLAIAQHINGQEDAPALFYNLGGPGGAAVSSLVSQVTGQLGDDVVKMYNIIAVDPRGVGASTPVSCMTDAERDENNAGSTDGDSETDELSPEEQAAEAVEASAKLAKGCEKYTGDLYKHIDTVSAARDFDMVRGILGQDSMNYIGYSYGTFLGATYAGLFPDKVGRFVLDGAVDPAMNVNEVSEAQTRGLEESLHHWIEDCHTASSCPIGNNPEDGIKKVVAFLERLKDKPLETANPDRPLTQSLALSAMIGMMYNTQTYTTLTEAMKQAFVDNDGSALLYLADFFNDRNQDGTYSSTSGDALIAINNLDYTSVGTVDEWAAEAKKLRDELPILGKYSGYSSAGVSAWPTKHAERRAIRAEGAAPIVVVGTTHDPATPYVMSQNLAAQLSSGVLVTNEGWDHTSYSKSANACVVGAVEGYLVRGIVPDNGLSCSD